MCAIIDVLTQFIAPTYQSNLTMKLTSISVAIFFAARALAHGGLMSYTVGGQIYEGYANIYISSTLIDMLNIF